MKKIICRCCKKEIKGVPISYVALVGVQGSGTIGESRLWFCGIKHLEESIGIGLRFHLKDPMREDLRKSLREQAMKNLEK